MSGTSTWASPTVVSNGELSDLRDTVRDFLARECSSARIRALIDENRDHDPGVWARLGSELGVLGIGIPEEYGGAGAGMSALSVVVTEAGRALLPSPMLSTVVAGQALLALGDDATRYAFLPEVATGELSWAVTLDNDLRAIQDGDEWRLDGSAGPVPDASTADLVLVGATGPEGPVLLTLEAAATGVTITPLDGMDLTRRRARITAHDVPARLISSRPGAVAHAADLASILLAGEQVGLAEWCLETGVAYARSRHQFGRPIGAFQAVKHRLAEMHTDLELARSVTHHAIDAVEEAVVSTVTEIHTDRLPAAASTAQLVCSVMASQMALDTVRVLGGIGFTWEHDAHLYLRRAKADELTFGSPAKHRERLAVRTGLVSA